MKTQTLGRKHRPWYWNYRLIAHFLSLITFASFAQQKPLTIDKAGKIIYTADALGNRIPDFSYCGYKAGNEGIPNVEIKIRIIPTKGDVTDKIQSAINYVSSLPINNKGFRGVVFLEKGNFQVFGTLFVRASGVVIRGAGIGQTIITGAGTSRYDLIRFLGKNDKKNEASISITDAYVPVNARKISVANTQNLKIGDNVSITRPSTKKWIQDIGTEHFGGGITSLGWKPNQRNIVWDRTITAINGNAVTIDTPLTTALDSTYGGGTLVKYEWQGRIENIGLENLTLESTFNPKNPKDEDHRWTAVNLENIQNGWIRQVDFRHFAGSAVHVAASSKNITVEDSRSFAPISEIGGERRKTFFTMGQQCLFQRLYSEFGYHDFAVGFCAAGPNAFVQCEAHLPHSYSGGIDSWASGVLFDIVNSDGGALRFSNLGQDAQGAGWAVANGVFWQCSASRIECYRPPTAQNWAFGSWASFAGNGYWDMSNEHLQPRSLYYAQLSERLGNEFIINRKVLLPVESEASSSPKVEVAMALTKLAQKPALQLVDFIGETHKRTPISTNAAGQTVDQIGIPKIEKSKIIAAIELKNGWLVRGNKLQTGKKHDITWWNGSSRPYALDNAKPHITRFVPGINGKGATDDLNEVTDWLSNDNIKAIDHNYGLWYDRRRDDHERVRRIDGEVWPPFYELPFARSGQQTAWDGLSKYDLTTYNKWYWQRLREYATLADEKGLLLYHQHYFQHNIIEAGAHYADFPWRTANNINQTEFPEPVPYAGDKRIFMAEQFYDIKNAVRRKLHTAYIRQCLDNFVGTGSVIQFISAEFTGNLEFVQFWLDVIKNWENEKKQNAIVALSTTKDVQDAILNDPKRASIVDIIDIRYWHYQANGTAYEPKGGQNLAPRQHARLMNPKKTSFEQVYKAVNEYRLKNSKKAVFYNGDSHDAFGWAVLMAGGSMAAIPKIADENILLKITQTQPIAWPHTNQWALANSKGNWLIYNSSGEDISLDLTKISGEFMLTYIDPITGKCTKYENNLKGGFLHGIPKKSNAIEVVWIEKIID